MKTTPRDRLIDIALYILVSVFSLLVLYPFYFVVINSVNARLDIRSVFIWPEVFSGIGYRMLFLDKNLSRAIITTVLRTIAGVSTTLVFVSMAAFALRKKDLKLRNFYLVLFLIPRFFGGGLIPYAMVIRGLGIYNTFLVYVLPTIWNFFFCILIMSAFNDVGQELEDSARIDGAGSFLIYYRIYIPLIGPVLATIALFEGVSQWNQWFDTLFFTRGTKLLTLSALLVRIIRNAQVTEIMALSGQRDELQQQITIENLQYATMVFTTVPILMIYPFVQKYFVKGIKIGAIKG